MSLPLNPFGALLSVASVAARRSAHFMRLRGRATWRNTPALTGQGVGPPKTAASGVLPPGNAPAAVAVPAVGERLLLSAGARVEATPTQDGIPVNMVIHLAWQVIDADAWPLPGPPQTSLLLAFVQHQMRELLAVTGLAALLVEREASEARLQHALQVGSAGWGLSVELVVIHQVDIPVSSQIENEVHHLCALRQCLERRRSAFC